MEVFKIYTTKKKTLLNVCIEYGVDLDYLEGGHGKGYVLSGNVLRVFIDGSHVDRSTDIKDITADYL
ncbi:hypothetical protein [Vibrio phage RYC]|nr:hypothetical protein [Vibrio phage RYC]